MQQKAPKKAAKRIGSDGRVDEFYVTPLNQNFAIIFGLSYRKIVRVANDATAVEHVYQAIASGKTAAAIICD